MKLKVYLMESLMLKGQQLYNNYFSLWVNKALVRHFINILINMHSKTLFFKILLRFWMLNSKKKTWVLVLLIGRTNGFVNLVRINVKRFSTFLIKAIKLNWSLNKKQHYKVFNIDKNLI